MNVTLTNITTVFSNNRPVVVAVLRSEEGAILQPAARLADQLIYIERNGFNLLNSLEALRTVILNLGFAA